MSTHDRDSGRSSSFFTRLRRGLWVGLVAHGSAGLPHARAAEPSEAQSDGVAAMSLGDGTTCVVTHEGRAKCWGLGEAGQLGRGDTQTIGDDEVPGSVGFIELGGLVREIHTNGRQTYARLDSGVVRAWGSNDSFELGLRHAIRIGDDETPATAEVAVDVELSAPATQLAVGEGFACARLADGTAQCWGANDAGQLGLGHTERIGDDESPADAGRVALSGAAQHVAAGAHHACAQLSGGEVQCWGRGTDGQLGYGDTEDVGDDELPAARAPLWLGEPVVELVAGEAHTCARLLSGAVRCWGRGEAGRLGLGHVETIGDDEPPTDVDPVPLGEPAVSLAAGARHTCAVLEGGDLYCWGEGLDGRLGHGDEDDVGDDERPVEVGAVALGDRVVDAVFGGPTASSTCVRLDDGAVRCWGLGDAGQLGYGDSASRGDQISTKPLRIPDVIVIDGADD